MPGAVKRLFFGTLRRQLIIGVALVHAVMMSLFIWDLTVRQQAMLLDSQTEHATALAHSIATSSAGWLAARDFYGLQEIMQAQSRYPELLYAMILDLRGQVVAHTDIRRLGQYLTDLPETDADLQDIHLLSHTAELVDVAARVKLAGRDIGWVRVGLGQNTIGRRLRAITTDGVLYALAAILIGSVLAGVMGVRLTRRLHAIQKAADAVRAGKSSVRAEVGGIDEAAGLAEQFNGMLDTLAEREAALHNREAHLRTLVQTLPDLVWLKDPEGVYLACNNRFERFFGASAADIVGKTDYDFVDKETADFFRLHDRKAVEAGRPSVNEETITFASDGHQELLETIKTPMFDAEGNMLGILGIGRDITERKKAELALAQHKEQLETEVEQRTRDLVKAKEAAEAANRAKSVFLANMSHELRTPLNAILGFAQLMAGDQRLPADQRQNLETINRSGIHLLSLINDVLEISKIEAGRLRLDPEPVDLHELLAGIAEFMAIRAKQKGLRLHLEQDPELPRHIEVDVTKLRQILINLLSNAVKYTNRGEVGISVACRTEGPRQMLEIEVADTGVGIDEHELEKVFSAFYQTEQGILLGEGTGLGLAISKEYANLLGGSITATSRAGGQGSVFRLSVPIVLAAPSAVKSAETAEVVGLAPGQPEFRILVAEDNEDSRRLIRILMERAGFSVRVVTDGRQAVQQAEAWNPHLIWMDMRMPEMDGYEATRRIKQTAQGGQIKIAALTASAFEEDREAILACGCEAFVRKPVHPQELFAVMRELLGVRYLYAQPPSGEQDVSGPIDQDALAALPGDLRLALRTAAVELDVDALERVIGRIDEHSKPLADALRILVAGFRFDLIADAGADKQPAPE